jgi:glycerate 2-kinase
MNLSSESAGGHNHSTTSARAMLRSLFDAALAAVDPLHCVAAHLPPRPKGKTLIVGAGKASARMARAVEAAWDGPLSGLVVTRYGHGEACSRIEVVEAGHPVPDEAGAAAAQRMLDMAHQMGPDDLVLALMSGGGSSLITLPAEGLTVDELRSLNRALLNSGAPIGEMNMVRRHLSAIKGGRLALACGAAAVHTLVISDVPGDDPAVVASGPTVPDLSQPQDALAVLKRRGISVPDTVLRVLQRPAAATAAFTAGPRTFGSRSVSVIATADTALRAAVSMAQQMGLEVINLGGNVEGESRDVARQQAAMARGLRAQHHHAGKQRLLISGGETTVTVSGQGRGGRNSEFLLALALALHGAPGIHALAADTDGIDGVEDNAGGYIGPDSLHLAGKLGLNPQALLDNNDAYAFLSSLGDLICTGPTRTNVNDFRALLIT